MRVTDQQQSFVPHTLARGEGLLERLRTIFADTYRVEEELKGGGMSRLFRATDLALNRLVVIKILPPELTSDVLAARFKRETEVTARLKHQNILPILDSGLRDDLMFYVMPFVAGESLRERLHREIHLPVREAISILSDVASALSSAHKQGIIHRDVKPENILLQGWNVYLADFGIAAAFVLPGETPATRLTRTGMSMGTVGYMAPEQSLGERDADHRADIYALGVVAYEMLAGMPPFTGATTQAIIAANLIQPPPRLDLLRAETPGPICKAIAKALEKNPAKRFQDAAELVACCAPFLTRS